VKQFFLSLHDQAIELACSDALAHDVALMFRDCLTTAAPVGRRITVDAAENDLFSFRTIDGPPIVGMTRGDVPAFLMDEVVRGLIVDLNSAVALHAGAVARNGKAILVPGATGSGKSSLIAWLVDRAFDYLTDEITLLVDAKANLLGLPRAMVIKPGAEKAVRKLSTFAGAASLSSGEQFFLSAPGAEPKGGSISCGLIIFPQFTDGADIRIEALSPAAAALRLIACNLNARNLPDGGFAAISRLARSAPAVSLVYGAYEQLEDVIDALAHIVLDYAHDPAQLRRFLLALSGSKVRAPHTNIERFPVPPATPRRQVAPRLTIGMATYDDYDGVYFSLQGTRLYHPEILPDVEFVVIDNHPDGPCSKHLKALENSIANYRYVPFGDWSGSTVREFVFEEAQGEFVLCMDCHVLVIPGALKRLLRYLDARPNTKDLLQGPLLYDDLSRIATHFHPKWQGGMWGHWTVDERGVDADAPPFDIPMQGLGLFACSRAAWPGFNPRFRGFGGEEGYIHEKFRRNGGRTLCLPFLRWVHRFNRPMGPRYVNTWEDRVRNYMIGFYELGLATDEVERHFAEILGEAVARPILNRIRDELADEPVSGARESMPQAAHLRG
jgi:hypothetical protein